ncbi:protein nlp8 [Phtheirospermum japonicum]|uniref:Protein nlp8 n=1 Tax=Phtheirospermum japonicum TaxID=374723 RepID=A0A830CB32_9LAMI|nr:protein nlp8 [Phtheirospermum japonicum]
MARTIMPLSNDDNSQVSDLDLVESMLSLDDVDMDDHGCCNLSDEMLSSIATSALHYDPYPNLPVPRPLMASLNQKLQRAFQLFKEDSSGEVGGSMLAQMWVSMMSGDRQVLSTWEQPCLHDQTFSNYREVSRVFTFATEQRADSFPGRVFILKVTEWTSNVMYYNRVQKAVDHEVQGSIAMPVFKLVRKNEIFNFDEEVESVCRELKVVDLSITPPRRLHPQSLSENQKAALAEIKDVLSVICRPYQLPLALTWIPCYSQEDIGDESPMVALDMSSCPVACPKTSIESVDIFGGHNSGELYHGVSINMPTTESPRGSNDEDKMRSIPVDTKIMGYGPSTSSVMTPSTKTSSSGSESFYNEKSASENKITNISKMTVKATYKDDIVRFKFEPASGCLELYAEVAKRFKLQTEQFILKYLNDEQEWMMLRIVEYV